MNEAFVYKWTNQTNGKIYIGYHKGSTEDEYISSSYNKEFWKDFRDNNHDFTREILATGTAKDMLDFEASLLKEANASKDPNYYNLRNGHSNTCLLYTSPSQRDS